MLTFLQKKTHGWVLFFLLFINWQIQAANEIVLSVSGGNKLKVIENTSGRLQVSNTLSSFNTLLLSTDKGEFVELLVNSYTKTNLAGAPQLPVISKMIEVPAGSTPRVKIMSYDLAEYKLSDFGITQKLFPAQPPQPKNNRQEAVLSYNKQIYEANSFYGEALARVEVAGFMRNIQLANFVLSPVEYNPVTNCIRVYNNLVVEISFEGAGNFKSKGIEDNLNSPYFSSVFNNTLNHQPDAAELSQNSAFPVKYVIVSDPMFRDALQPFIRWKTRRGFNVTEAYTDEPEVGNSLSSIKAYLQNLYTSATTEDPAPTFVLFVGDVAQIPAFDCGGHVSDLYYCEYTGDYLPEVFYGRFSANTVAELLPQINKTLQYEQYLMPDPSFLNEAVLAAGADATHQVKWGNGQVNYLTTNYFNADHNLVAHTYLQPEPAGSNYSRSIQADISRGVAYANYSAHGNQYGWASPSFTLPDIENLRNEGKYGLIVGNSCQTSAYNLNSFGEALVRAENKGALGYIGASDLTYWDEDYWWSVGNGSIVSSPTYETTGLGAYDRTFHDHGEPASEWYSTMGQMVFAGNLAVQESNSGMKKYYWEIYCLMGDPSTMVYFSEPRALTAKYARMLPLGSSFFEVRTEPYACVAISKNDKLFGVSVADDNGLAVVSLQPFSQPGFANIVITKQNRQPFIDSVMVSIPQGPFLVHDLIRITDSGGNSNQFPVPGEQLSVDFSLNNMGITDAKKAVSILSTNDAFLTVSSNTYSWPDIPATASARATQAFSFRVNDNVQDMHKASMVISTHTDTCTFISEFSFNVYAPKLKNGSITFNDAAEGNGNGRIDPGETIYISVPVSNSGHCTSAEVTTRLFVFGDNVTTNSKALNLGTLVPGATGTSVFSFTVSRDAVPGSTFSLYVVAEAGPYNSVSGLEPVIGQQIEDFETGDFTKYNWSMNGNKPWEIAAADLSGGRFVAKSGVINNLERSEMYLEGQALTTDTISFYRKVSSESGYDFLTFYLDDTEMGSWSGNKDWAKVSYPVAAGNHRMRWTYEKDEATAAGQDAAWIDNIRLPSFVGTCAGPLTVKVLAEPATICAGGQSQLYVFAGGKTEPLSYAWFPSASLNSASIFNPSAQPGETTTYEVQVTGKLSSASKRISVDVINRPETPVIKSTNEYLVSSAITGNQWFNRHGPVTGANSQFFYPENTGAYYAITKNAEGCPSAASNEISFEAVGIINSAANGFSVYPNPFTGKIYLNYTLKSTGPVKIIIYNSIGMEAGIIEEGVKAEGAHEVIFDGSHLAAGIYTCIIFRADTVNTARVIRSK